MCKSRFWSLWPLLWGGLFREGSFQRGTRGRLYLHFQISNLTCNLHHVYVEVVESTVAWTSHTEAHTEPHHRPGAHTRNMADTGGAGLDRCPP